MVGCANTSGRVVPLLEEFIGCWRGLGDSNSDEFFIANGHSYTVYNTANDPSAQLLIDQHMLMTQHS